jgi:serine/threonine protein kinase
MKQKTIDGICDICEETEYRQVFNFVNISAAMYRIAKFGTRCELGDRVVSVWAVLEPLAIKKASHYSSDCEQMLQEHQHKMYSSILDISSTIPNLVWALAQLDLKPMLELIEFINLQCKVTAREFSAQNFTSVIWAFARLNIPVEDSPFRFLQGYLEHIVPECCARSLLDLEEGLMTLHPKSCEKLSGLIKTRAQNVVSELALPSDVCALLKLFLKLDLEPAQSNIILPVATKVVPKCEPHQIANIVFILAKLKLTCTSELQAALNVRIMEISASFDLQDIVTLFWAFAKTKQSIDTQVVVALKAKALSSSQSLSGRQMQKLNWALFNLGIKLWVELKSEPRQTKENCAKIGELSLQQVSHFLDSFRYKTSFEQIAHSSLPIVQKHALLKLYDFFANPRQDEGTQFEVVSLAKAKKNKMACSENLPRKLRKEWMPDVVLGSGLSGAVVKIRSPGGLVRVLKIRYLYFRDHDRKKRKCLSSNFMAETKCLEKVHSAHLPRFHLSDLCIDNELAWLMVQHVDGEKLSCRKALFSEKDAVEAGVSILLALEEIHQHKLIHGDVRPCNVIRRSDNNTYVLVDYSSSFLLSEFEEHPGMLSKTHFPYASPEMFEGEVAGQGDDLWSVGVILYELVSGQLPFQAESHGDDVNMTACIHKSEAPQLFATDDSKSGEAGCAKISQEFSTAVTRALSKDVGKRFQTARGMIRGLPTEKQVNKERFEALMSKLVHPCLCRLWRECWYALHREEWHETKDCVRRCMEEIKSKNHHSYALVSSSEGRLLDWDITALVQLLRVFYHTDNGKSKLLKDLSKKKLPHIKYLCKDKLGRVARVKSTEDKFQFVEYDLQEGDIRYLFESLGFQRNFYKHLSEVKDIPDDLFLEHWMKVKELLCDLGEDTAFINQECERIWPCPGPA